MSNIIFENNKIKGSVLENATINSGSGNIINSMESKAKSLNEYLDEVINNTSSCNREITCAKKIRKLYINNNTEKLKKFLLRNYETITTGTFAATAGGLLVELLKKILFP